MRETRTSGLTSGDGKRGDAHAAQATAPVLDSTERGDVNYRAGSPAAATTAVPLCPAEGNGGGGGSRRARSIVHVAALGRVEDGRGGLGRVGIAPFPVPARQTGRAGFPHPAFRLASPRGTRQGAKVNPA